MSKPRNIVFILVCLLSFLSVAICLVSMKCPLPLPLRQPFELLVKTRSFIEGRNLHTTPDISPSTFLDKTLQQESELFLSDYFPGGALAPLANALPQRGSIVLANMLFNFDIYPTFFGSTVVYGREHNALYRIPTKIQPEETAAATESVERFSRLAQIAKCSVVCIAENTTLSTLNPVHKYVKSLVDTQYYRNTFATPLSKSGVSTILRESKNVTDLWINNFKSEDHWTIFGAYDAYATIARELGFSALKPSSTICFEQYFFVGTLSRVGLDFFDKGDYIEDYLFEYPQFEITLNGIPTTRGDKQGYRNGTVSIAHFGDYFGDNLNSVLLYRQKQHDTKKGNLLLLADSFVKPIEQMLASHYNETTVIMPSDFKGTFDIESYVKENDIDDIVVVSFPDKILDKAWLSLL